jgi:hypothetical protein
MTAIIIARCKTAHDPNALKHPTVLWVYVIKERHCAQVDAYAAVTRILIKPTPILCTLHVPIPVFLVLVALTGRVKAMLLTVPTLAIAISRSGLETAVSSETVFQQHRHVPQAISAVPTAAHTIFCKATCVIEKKINCWFKKTTAILHGRIWRYWRYCQ